MQSFGLTDKGCVRPTNQDVYEIQEEKENETALLVVCDGMGGANAGNVASRFAAESVMGEVAGALKEELNEEKRQALLEKALAAANETVFALASKQPEFRGMGTTLVCALVQKNAATLLNVGDSRAYIFDGETLHQITEDHSYVEEMRRQGKLTAEAAKKHPQKNLITRAVGVDSAVEGDLFEVEVKKGEILLLCTDGLTGMVEDTKISEILKKENDLIDMADVLLRAAKGNGGRDNITIALYKNEKEKGA